MKLRVEKRKPELLDLTVYEALHPALPNRKQASAIAHKTKSSKSHKKQTLAASLSSPSSTVKGDFVNDKFTENMFDEHTKCALCAGDRQMVTIL